jgi:hypothetical protein
MITLLEIAGVLFLAWMALTFVGVTLTNMSDEWRQRQALARQFPKPPLTLRRMLLFSLKLALFAGVYVAALTGVAWLHG